ncbi:hypothetical protein Patl1_09747 [Pistacia atlantica]|uniref:Uncharacterized protein n=1 Tax=Pistacia atlantica TaxID=434234 RepID=A0ACC1A3X0_9ROSI|nr:hypothetical protein Patl1_09747 [Pistacia atlantica]
MDEHSVMFLTKFSFFLVLFVLCPLDSGSRSRCSAQMTGDYAPSPSPSPSPAPRSSSKFSEADALDNVVYYFSLTSPPTISSSFCDRQHHQMDQSSLNSINIACSNTIGPDNEWHITEITMASVSLDGFIHPDITKLTYLQTLDLSNNQLHDSIPSNLGDLSHLTILDLSSNQLTGTIPLSLGNLKNLTELDLWSNKLSGAIPPELGNLSQLQLLSLDENELNGTLPKQLGNLSNLRALWVTSNNLTGEVPDEYEKLGSLEVFHVLKSINLIVNAAR